MTSMTTIEIAVLVYAGAGLVCVGQAVGRQLVRVNDLESFCLAVGAMALWPIVLVVEIVEIDRRLRGREP